jgi:hypothetical protein
MSPEDLIGDLILHFLFRIVYHIAMAMLKLAKLLQELVITLPELLNSTQ